MAAVSATPPFPHLEVEDPRVVFSETLIMGYNSEKQPLIQGQAGDGCKKPAVPCEQTDPDNQIGASPLGRACSAPSQKLPQLVVRPGKEIGRDLPLQQHEEQGNSFS